MRNECLRFSLAALALSALSAAHAPPAAEARAIGGVAEPYAMADQRPLPTVEALPGLAWVDQQALKLPALLEGTRWQVSSGFSGAWIWNANDPFTGDNALRPLADQANAVDVELFQAAIGWNPQPAGGEFGFGAKLDVGRVARQIKADWNGSGAVPDADWEPKSVEFQEAWIAYTAPLGRGLTLRAGRLTTLLGAEVPEPWLNKNFSRSFLYGYAIPQTHTGGYATYQLTDMIALTAGAVVGWNNVQDNNNSASGIGQLAIQPNEKFRLYVSGIIGPEQTCPGKPGEVPPLYGEGCNANKRGVVDVVIGMRPLPGLEFVLNYDYGSESEASVVQPGQHAVWTGFSGIASYTRGRWQTALRGEWFQDFGGSRTGQRQNLWAVTLDGKIMLSELIYLRAEYRHDESTAAVFPGRRPGLYHRGQDTIAIELGYAL